MSKRSVEAAMDFSFPTPEERRAAMCVCCGSHCPGCESPDDYAWRRRDVDLSVLADEAAGLVFRAAAGNSGRVEPAFVTAVAVADTVAGPALEKAMSREGSAFAPKRER